MQAQGNRKHLQHKANSLETMDSSRKRKDYGGNMGQRSQIYVRYNKKLVITNYYQWNYGERMISRARYGIEYIKENYLEYRTWIFNNESDMEKLRRIFDVNFDMKDIVMSIDIIKEWKEQFSEDESFNNYVFKLQSNNDGKLFVDISEDGIVKYAFLDCECDTEHIMSASQYMTWNHKDWRISKYITDEQKSFCEDNLKKIEEMAALMTKSELEDFINYNYGMEELPF